MQLEAVLQKIVNRRRERLAVEGPELSARLGNGLELRPGNSQQPEAGMVEPADPPQSAGLKSRKPEPGQKSSARTDLKDGEDFSQAPFREPLPFLPRGGLICEIKRRSPSRGSISEISDPAALARLYREKGASAISVLTEEDHFGGSLTDLAEVRKAVPDMPLLRKDFLFSPEDIRTSRLWGADAVLLITRILDDAALKAFFQNAREEGLSVLAEAHSQQDINRLRPYRPSFVGINSRDLETFTINPLLPAALGPMIDWPALHIWESGIFDFEDARLASSCNFRGILVGEGAVRKPETIPSLIRGLGSCELERGRSAPPKVARPFFWSALAKRTLGAEGKKETEGKTRGPEIRVEADAQAAPRDRPSSNPALQPFPKRPLVKICGITRTEDAVVAARAGADILGFILAESPRKVDELFIRSCAKEIDHHFPGERGPLRVVVVVEESPAAGKEPADDYQLQLARKLLSQGVIDAVQLHGTAEPADCVEMAFPYYKALRPKSLEEARKLSAPAGEGGYHCPRLLVDAFSIKQAGGTGKRVDPEIIQAVQSSSGRPLWLAGGITPEHVARFCRDSTPELIDLSSGVESEPGIKDHGKIKMLFENLKGGVQDGDS